MGTIKKSIREYCAKTPENTNLNIINNMLENYEDSTVPKFTIEDIIFKTLTEVTSDCDTLPKYAFKDYSQLKTISFPNVEDLSEGQFLNCTSLENINLPNLRECGAEISGGWSGAFASAGKMDSTISLPTCEKVGWNSFSNSNFSKIELPSVTEINSTPFDNCARLKILELPNCITMSQKPFGGGDSSTKLEKLILGKRINTDFNNNRYTVVIPDTTIIYVQPQDLSWYANNMWWSVLYNTGKIKSVEELLEN